MCGFFVPANQGFSGLFCYAGQTKDHYEHFIIEALASDRLSAREEPERSRNHISTREFAREPVKLIANMYELTDAICHNHW